MGSETTKEPRLWSRFQHQAWDRIQAREPCTAGGARWASQEKLKVPVPGASRALGPGKTNASVHGTTASDDPSRPLPGLLRVAALASGAADEGKGSSRQHARARLTQLQVGLPPLDTVAGQGWV